MFDVDCRLYNSLAGDVVWLWCFLVVGRRTGRFSVKFIPLGSSTKSTYLILRECIRHCPQADFFLDFFFGVDFFVPRTTMTSAGRKCQILGFALSPAKD